LHKISGVFLRRSFFFNFDDFRFVVLAWVVMTVHDALLSYLQRSIWKFYKITFFNEPDEFVFEPLFLSAEAPCDPAQIKNFHIHPVGENSCQRL
jgi:hypothetical protein